MEHKDLKEERSQANDSVPDEKLTSETNDSVPDDKLTSKKHVDSEDHKNNVEQKSSNIEKESTDEEQNEADKEDGAAVDRTLYVCDVPSEEKETEPVFYGTENPEAEIGRSPGSDSGVRGAAWPEKATAIKNFFMERGVMIRKFSEKSGIPEVIRRLSLTKREEADLNAVDSEGKIATEETKIISVEEDKKENNDGKVFKDWGAWNPLNLVKNSLDKQFNQSQGAYLPALVVEPAFKGRIILFSCSESQQCRAARSFLRQKGLKFVEINTDIYPGRKTELENIAGSSSVPKIFFNELCLGGMNEVRAMEESGELDEKIKGLIETEPPSSAPLPPSAGEDDFGNNGMVDELANVVRKLREVVVVKDRFYKMRMFTRSFVGSEAVDFLSEDQLLERDEAVEFGRKLASKHFFHHVLNENVFEDGNHPYRFMEHDPVVSANCYNFTGGTNDMKPKPPAEIAARLRSLTQAIYEAYTSDDGKHVDYRNIGASEEFIRYLKVIEELHRIDLHDLTREEKLAFFINLYNMMAIHAIVLWGYPDGPLERRRFFGEFKYVIGGYSYSLSAIQNGVLRSNKRPPYNLIKPFGLKDKRIEVALSDPEPLVHFALVCGSRSSPAIRCYSPGSIDEELRLAGRIFFDDGGFLIDVENKLASVSKIMNWYSVDFGKNETEVVKFIANYLEPSKSEQLLELLNGNQLKVTYQSYDWALNC